jgi:NIMA-interacting peptidyl-prolyl cis-trans isomerase 1
MKGRTRHQSNHAEQVRCAHLLIKHTGSRNPVSRRTGAQVTLTPEEALAELKTYESRIKSEGIASAFPTYGERRMK